MSTLKDRLDRGTHYQAGKWVVTKPLCGYSQLLERQVNGELHVLHHSLPFTSALESAYARHLNYCQTH